MEQSARNERALVEASQHGEENAFRELMVQYISPIFNFARQYAKTHEDAEDITQETFYKAWRHIERFDPEKKFLPWLYAIARNTALDYLKKRRASTFSELDAFDSDLQFVDSLEDESPLPPELFERGELAKELSDSMKDLHPDHRAVLVMHYNEELTFNEIAEIMDKPMNTVKSWHRRALNKIRKSLLHRNPRQARI